MSTMDNAVQEDALDSWISDLAGGETSMRRLRRKLTAERDQLTSGGLSTEVADDDVQPNEVEDNCRTCHGSTTGHPGSILRPIS